MSPVVRRDGRGIAPVAGVLLIAITVVLAGGVATATLDAPSDPPPSAVLSLSATDDRVSIYHRGGDPIDVAAATVRVRVDGEPLDEQPPVPFFSATGYRPGPTGPFNAASGDTWRAGDTATFRVAGTTRRSPRAGR
ncbi:hypothetical protein C472_09768 [Halorubrum tebenquichense DSM 14210]|uniref:Archaeal Type IV pilin N-terminal domain-containing protein n=1 Tax=Halorubrum tebenquichense DSM 14210 TaxID=1227485 RepID=M0DMX4_9EURY|nr:hypothetical protein C472_09768 [Halorubrum tebenquichense DSM 14210]